MEKKNAAAAAAADKNNLTLPFVCRFEAVGN